MKKQLKTITKSTYSEPKLEQILLDYEISLALESFPPIFEIAPINDFATSPLNEL